MRLAIALRASIIVVDSVVEVFGAVFVPFFVRFVEGSRVPGARERAGRGRGRHLYRTPSVKKTFPMSKRITYSAHVGGTMRPVA